MRHSIVLRGVGVLLMYTLVMPVSLVYAEGDVVSTPLSTESNDSSEVSEMEAEDDGVVDVVDHVEPIDEVGVTEEITDEEGGDAKDSETSAGTDGDMEEVRDTDDVSTTTNDATLAPLEAATSTDPLGETASSTHRATTTDTNTLALFGTSTPATTTATTTASTSTDDGGDQSTITDISVLSGRAVALANVMNIVNTNFINSEGIVVFKNFFETLFEDLDLRDLYSSLTTFGCSLSSCTTEGVRTNVMNDATIDNSLYVEAVTGGNTIEGGNDAVIRTGDAYAGVNLVNVANTNVIDSQYLLLTMNAFNDVDGDIVFPSLGSFFRNLADGASSASVVNTADVVNDVDLTAGSGGNTITAGSSTISSGEARASGNVFNSINTTLSGGQSVAIVFRVHGDWAGEIFGAPPNIGWMEDGEGGIYLFDTGVGATSHAGGSTIAATNTASIRNNVQVVALTGDNAITGANTALISAGNAYAGANIVNVANANVIGRNWILAIVNIFGNFKGNIAFGRPDLWVGGQANVPGKVQSGSEVTYTTTVINNGDSPATNVRLVSDYDEAHLAVMSATADYTDASGVLTFALPDIPPEGAYELSYQTRVLQTPPETDIDTTMRVGGREKDNSVVDNTDIVTIATAKRGGNGVKLSLSSYGRDSWDPARDDSDVAALLPKLADVIRIVRDEYDTDIVPGESSTQRLVIENTSSAIIPNVVVHDELLNDDDSTISNEEWFLGDVLPHEEITITYTLVFAPDAARGKYNFATHVESRADSYRIENGGITIGDTLESLYAYLPKVALEPLRYRTARAAEIVDVESTTTAVGASSGVTPQGEVLGTSAVLPPAYPFLPAIVPLIGAVALILALMLYGATIGRMERRYIKTVFWR